MRVLCLPRDLFLPRSVSSPARVVLKYCVHEQSPVTEGANDVECKAAAGLLLLFDSVCAAVQQLVRFRDSLKAAPVANEHLQSALNTWSVCVGQRVVETISCVCCPAG